MADDETPKTDAEIATLPAEGGAATAVAEGEEGAIKLQQQVEIRDVGPCKKHVKVTVDRGEIDKQFDRRFTEIVRSDQPQVRGFRPRKRRGR